MTHQATYSPSKKMQIEVLDSPIRVEILTSLEGRGPTSVSELAKSMGRLPDSLYYHIRKLVRVGLLIPSGTRKAARRDEALYDLPARMLKITGYQRSSTARQFLSRTVAFHLKSANLDCQNAILLGIDETIKPETFKVGRVKGRLSSNELEQVHALLKQIEAIMTDANKRDRGRMLSFTYAIAPLEPGDEAARTPLAPAW